MSGKLKTVFMGTPAFAAYNLKALHESEVTEIVAVVTAPDKPSGRGLKLTMPAVKEVAISLGLPVLQPLNLKDEGFIQELKSFNADLQVVVAFRMLPEVVWMMPPKGSFNLHASLLPQYRGAAPINWAIINGENQTGITTFFIEKTIDTGNIIMQQAVDIAPDDNAGSLHDKLMVSGSNLVIETVKSITHGTVLAKPQGSFMENCLLKLAPKIFNADCRLNWNVQASRIHDKIRGLSPYPGAWTQMTVPGKDAVTLKIFNSYIASHPACLKPGETSCDGKSTLLIGTIDMPIAVTEIQLAGRKVIGISDYLKGHRWIDGTLFI